MEKIMDLCVHAGNNPGKNDLSDWILMKSCQVKKTGCHVKSIMSRLLFDQYIKYF